MFTNNAAATYPPHTSGEYMMNLYAQAFMDERIPLHAIKDFVRWCNALSAGETELPHGLDPSMSLQIAAFASAGAAAAYNAREQIRLVTVAAFEWADLNPSPETLAETGGTSAPDATTTSAPSVN